MIESKNAKRKSPPLVNSKFTVLKHSLNKFSLWSNILSSLGYFGNTVWSRRDQHVRRPFNVSETLILSNRQAIIMLYLCVYIFSVASFYFFSAYRYKLLLPLSVPLLRIVFIRQSQHKHKSIQRPHSRNSTIFHNSLTFSAKRRNVRNAKKKNSR